MIQPATGVRVKGGICLLEDGTFHPVISMWDNPLGQGESSQDFVHPQAFKAEEEALSYYQKYLAPGLRAAMELGVDGLEAEVIEHWSDDDVI